LLPCEVDQSLIQPLEGISEEEFMENYYEPLVK
jgi:hypothetical protein